MDLDKKHFTMIDEEFTCVVCGKKVSKLGYTARDHCPYCLCSLHVDINPGDRANPCHGILRPVSLDKFKDTFKIVYKCDKCGELHRNIVATDDDYDVIIKIGQEKN